ncbi:MAG TPA: universal stress protein [Candidatus Dormibacteraeota bacterium]
MDTRRILICTDGSRASLAAARAAIDLAAGWKSEVRAVYVVETADADGKPAPEMIERMREGGRAILNRIAQMGDAKSVKVVQALLEGVPFEAILNDARGWKADLIVMGRTGRTGPGRALLGSEAERVLEFTERPVLIVPTIETIAP